MIWQSVYFCPQDSLYASFSSHGLKITCTITRKSLVTIVVVQPIPGQFVYKVGCSMEFAQLVISQSQSCDFRLRDQPTCSHTFCIISGTGNQGDVIPPCKAHHFHQDSISTVLQEQATSVILTVRLRDSSTEVLLKQFISSSLIVEPQIRVMIQAYF